MSEPRTLIDDLLWPAAAGNIVWSLYSLIDLGISENKFDLEIALRFSIVFLIACYACAYWIRGQEKPVWRRPFKFLHLATLTTTAVALHLRPEFSGLFFTLFFGVNVIAHSHTLTYSDIENPDKWRTKYMLGFNTIGLLCGLLPRLICGSYSLCWMLIGILAPVIAWIFYKK